MAREALRRGHSVELFHRGTTSATGLKGAAHLIGDRSGDLSALAQGRWDAVVDACAYRPGEIESMADALAGRFAKYLFISSVSVYADDIAPDCDEAAARMDTSGLTDKDLATIAVDAQTYGPLKVLCEDAVVARHENHVVIRPTYVIGPEDYTQRYPEWVRRIAAGGEVSAPGPRDAPIQYIDARDLARFVVLAIEHDLQGAFNAAAPQPPYTFENFLDETTAGVAPEGTSLNWLTPAQATESGLQFPLWAGGSSYGKAAVNSGAAKRNGLNCRPLRETAMDVLAWSRQGPA
jgi:2'-hydroxyisoflavone reductase